MTPRELYAMPHVDIHYNPRILFGCYYNHTNGDVICEYGDEFQNSSRLEIRIIKDFHFDGRRFWRLATVWLDDDPVMIIQNAGREGDDYHKRFITDEKLYKDMVIHIRELRLPYYPEIKEIRCVGMDDKNENLIKFYGNELSDYFEIFR
jgi:hypothetical protein